MYTCTYVDMNIYKGSIELRGLMKSYLKFLCKWKLLPDNFNILFYIFNLFLISGLLYKYYIFIFLQNLNSYMQQNNSWLFYKKLHLLKILVVLYSWINLTINL